MFSQSEEVAFLSLDGVSGDHIAIGRSFTVHGTARDGTTLANAMQLDPDWLLDALASMTFSGLSASSSRHFSRELFSIVLNLPA